MTPLEMVVIDEAAQLKECESTIPLQLLGLCHAILIRDEKQLPSMVQRKIYKMDEFGRSLLERIVILGHKKHLLNELKLSVGESRYDRENFSPEYRQILFGRENLREDVESIRRVKTFKMKEFRVTLAYDKLKLDQSTTSTYEARVLAM
ncbi:hypothetical protein FXO37_30212 [Capsicum annuum]|nr:hypothetical protein FXO37_30212 [Capsicum annuum]